MKKPPGTQLALPATVKSPEPQATGSGLTERKWQRRFLQVLRQTPDVKSACRVARIARSTAYRRRDADPAFRQQWDDALGASVDELEGVAFKLAAEGDSRLIEFLLKSHRRDVYGDVSKVNIDTRLCGVLLLPQKEELPP